jgi:starch synthase
VARGTGAAEPAIEPFVVDFDWAPRRVELRTMSLASGVTLALFGSPDYFERPNIYGEWDDDKRYVFFSKFGLEAIRRAGWRPDVVHVHDWHTAAAINWLAIAGRHDPFWSEVGTVITIHNLAYQGWTDQGVIGLLGVEAGGMLGVEWQRFAGRVNLLARGLSYADAITTVSPTYAREILTPEGGEGLDDLLRSRADRLRGILNGLDLTLYDPATDRRLAANFDAEHPAPRAANARQLRGWVDLPESEAPLIGIVSRLTDQKGFDLMIGALEPLLELDTQIVLLGAGEPAYEGFWRVAAQRHPSHVAVRIGFEASLAQLIYGGSDLFLMPSRFEPGGLGQLFAMRYGSVPIVRATGGLADTVRDADDDPAGGTGFVFSAYTPAALLDAATRAVVAYRQPRRWRALVRRAMAQEFTWQQSARAYEETYRLAGRSAAVGAPA